LKLRDLRKRKPCFPSGDVADADADAVAVVDADCNGTGTSMRLGSAGAAPPE